MAEFSNMQMQQNINEQVNNHSSVTPQSVFLRTMYNNGGSGPSSPPEKVKPETSYHGKGRKSPENIAKNP